MPISYMILDCVCLSPEKVRLDVTFMAEDGRTITCAHEVDSIDEEIIASELQKAAIEFNGRNTQNPSDPDLSLDTPITVSELNG